MEDTYLEKIKEQHNENFFPANSCWKIPCSIQMRNFTKVFVTCTKAVDFEKNSDYFYSKHEEYRLIYF